MPDEILSADELESLLSTVEDTGAGKREREQRILEYDFVRPNKLSGEQLRSLQRLHENMAQVLTMSLSTYLRVNLEVTVVSLGELTYEVFRNSLPNPTVVNVLSLPPLPERAVATMDMKLAFSLIDRMMGGPGKPLDKIRNLTAIEQSLLDNVIRRFLDKVTDGWADLSKFKAVVESREMDPQFAQVIPSSEMVLVATFSLSAPGELEPGEICFCVPFISISDVLMKLSNRFHFAAMKRAPTDGQRRHLDRTVKHTPLPVKVDLGTASLSIGEVMNMQPGDVIVLDQRTTERARGTVAGQLRFLCSLGRSGKQHAVRVERVLPPGKTPFDKE